MNPDRLLTAREVYTRIGASRAAFYEWLKKGYLSPIAPLKIGPCSTRYKLSAVEAFEALAAERGARS